VYLIFRSEISEIFLQPQTVPTTNHFFLDPLRLSAMVKRASPGADTEKSPLSDVELSDENAQKLQGVQKDIARTELVLGTF
jgi:hypothetical protein